MFLILYLSSLLGGNCPWNFHITCNNLHRQTSLEDRGSLSLGSGEQICFFTRIIKIMSSSGAKDRSGWLRASLKEWKESKQTNIIQERNDCRASQFDGFHLCSKPSVRAAATWASLHRPSGVWGFRRSNVNRKLPLPLGCNSPLSLTQEPLVSPASSRPCKQGEITGLS